MTTNSSLKSTKRHQWDSLIKLIFAPLMVALVVWGGHSYLKNRATRQAQEAEQHRESWKRYLLAGDRMGTLIRAAHDYAAEHDDLLPPSHNWEQALQPYASKYKQNISELVVCPLPPGSHRFAMNTALSSRRIRAPDMTGDEYSHVILFFGTSASGANAAGFVTSLSPPAANGEAIIGCLGGEVKVFYGPEARKQGLSKPASEMMSVVKRSYQIEQAITARQKGRLQ